ncbi:MAG: NusA-like transcription termination signal-binding factor [Halobacteriales archaeon]|nr:NusA-like transcription termination signal-binding factor [Halobacteriales archaeon]
MIRLSDEARQLIGFIEEASGATVRDCLVGDERVVFVVAPGEMADAIGPQGQTVARIEERLNKRVELVEDADDPGTFVANALRPAAVYDVTVREREGETIAYAEVNTADFGAAIGRGGKNIKTATELAGRHFDIDAIELVPQPDSVLDTVADVTGVEPADALFDTRDERLVVLAPTGSRAAIRDVREKLREELGWPVVTVTYASDPATLVEHALAPADIENVTVSALGTAYVEVTEEDRGLAIGSSGKRIRLARLLAAEYAGLDDVALT